MEKARLNVNKTKKGGYAVNLIIIESGKTLPISDIKLQNDALNGKEVDVLLEKGQVKQILCDGNTIYDKSASVGTTTQTGSRPPARNTSQAYSLNSSSSNTNSIDEAVAPYNFVSLNDRVVPAEAVPAFDTYHPDRHTGYIDLEIETKTPLYIRDTLTDEEMEIKAERERNGETYNPTDFFSPGGKLRIPGSSLRGMTRTMVEIVSFGKFGFFDDKRLYYRAVGDTSRLGEDYRNAMVNVNDNYFPKVKAGLFKNGKIYPAKVINGTQIYRINFNKYTGVIDTNYPSQPDFSFKEVFFTPIAPVSHTHYRFDKNRTKIPYQLKYAKLSSVSDRSDNRHTHKGYLITSGGFGNKKHMHWVINEPEKTGIVIDKALLASYNADANRDERADLLKKVEAHPEGVPCFYIVDNDGNIISFGHTGMFRLA